MTAAANAYSFLSWLRRGIATRITQPPGSAMRASVPVKLRVAGTATAGGGTLTQDVQHDVALYGPGDVIGVDPRAIVRTDPRDQVTSFEPNHLPFIEFYDEDFPWRYSPAVADPATGRLAPWLALIVLADGEFRDQGTLPGRPLPSIELVGSPATLLPPAGQLGAWAHVHVNDDIVMAADDEVASDDMAAVLPRLAVMLASHPDLACSRLICPRRLEPETGYDAFLVPAFETGRLAGLGLDPAGSPGALQSSWGSYPSRPESLSLCYYYHWRFRTSSVGDFEYLVRLLKPHPADGQIGHRDMDVRQPGTGLPAVTDDPQFGGVLWLGGALKPLDEDLTSTQLTQQQEQDEWDKAYPTPFQQALAALINLADSYTSQGVLTAHQNLPLPPPSGSAPPASSPAVDADPLVTPPLYGRWPAHTSRLQVGPGDTPVKNWLHELNLDPRFRVAAGTGGRVVRQHDEEYMQAAWDQLGDVAGANKRIRAAQFAREIGFALHAHRLAPLRQAAPGRLFAVSAPVQSRITLASAAAGVRQLTISAHFADSLSAATPLSPAMRRITRPGARLMRGLPFGAPGSGGLAGLAAGAGAPPGPDSLLARMNTGDVTAAAEKTAPTGVVTVDKLERKLAFIAPHHEIQPHLVLDPGVLPNPVSELPTSSEFVISMPGDGVHPAGGGSDSTEAVLFKQALNDTYVAFNSASLAGETSPRVSLDLAAAARATMDGLHPELTLPRRALGGIALPNRLRPPAAQDPGGSNGVVGSSGPGGSDVLLADLAAPAPAPAADPLAEVMAYPVIDLPMFRPLADMSPDLFCPNVNLVAPNSATLLYTNRRFIESYLVGLNHEMARELLWREYPTDQRGSVFRQFWDVRSALPSAQTPDGLRDITRIDAWDPGSTLGSHNIRGTSADDLVLVIRGELLKKYPTTVIYVQKAVRGPDGGAELVPVGLTAQEEADSPRDKVRMPLFDAKVEPDIYFFGFDLTKAEARGDTGAGPDDLGWFFIIKERPGDPRFGLDVERDGALVVWNDLAWPDVLPAAASAQSATDGTQQAVYIPLDATTLPPPPFGRPTPPMRTRSARPAKTASWPGTTRSTPPTSPTSCSDPPCWSRCTRRRCWGMPEPVEPTLEFVRWEIPEQHGSIANGALRGFPVTLEGPLGTAFFRDNYPNFSSAAFTPQLASTGMIEIVGAPGHSFTLTFGAPLTDPIMELGSLGSVLTFPAGTAVTPLSGDAHFTVADNVVTGGGPIPGPDGTPVQTDSNGSIQLTGTFSAITFTLVVHDVNPGVTDGVLFQIGGRLPPLDDAYPALLGPVRLEYRFTDTELRVRVFPDDWAVDSFEDQGTAAEHEHALRFWRRSWQAGGDQAEKLAAWRDLASHVGPGRAAHLAASRRPLNPADEPRRAHPGQVTLVVASDDPLAAGDRDAAARYWQAIYQAGRSAGALQAADTALDSAVGAARADRIRAQRPAGLDSGSRAAADPGADVAVAFLDMPAAGDTKASSWTQPARARLLPDTFTLLGYAGGELVLNLTGNTVPPDLPVGPDPGAPDPDQFTSADGGLHVPGSLKWLVDFDAAVSAGLAFRVPLSDAIRGGLDRLVVLGLRVRDPATSKADLETLITHQAGSRASFRLLAQGTPTNNTGQVPSALGTGDEAAESFAALSSPVAPVAASDWTAKADGQWLAELLGIDQAMLASVPGAAARDQAEARAMNVALWPATWGYHLGTTLSPIFGTAAVDASRTFFTRYVSGRGPVPAFRVGRQPYGVLVTTAFSRMTWADGDPDAAHRRVLNAVLASAAQEWARQAAKVAFLGADGDPHQLLLGILGLHATSAEFYQRYGQSVEDYYNRLNLAGAGDAVLAALAEFSEQRQIRDLLTQLGYPATAPDPDVMSRLFTGRQHPMRGPLVDDRPRSETDPVRPYTDDGRNYLAWLAASMTSSLDTVRLESGFTGNSPPTAILYLLLRHAVLNAYAESALRLTAAAHATSEADLMRARREPPFIHISQRTQVTESRYRTLYEADATVTGDPQRLLADHITLLVSQPPAQPAPATQHLAEQAAAIGALAALPTARLERTLVEHLDCCTYRLDAWRLGLASEKLFALRYPDDGTQAPAAVTGLHIGAFGWLEEVRPRAAAAAPVTLADELAKVFTPPGTPPLVRDDTNQGYIHAPSLPQASTAALLRTGYLAGTSPGNAATLAVNLSSGRVRTALALLDGLRTGQSLGALLGYQLERGLHDRHASVDTNVFIGALRQAFPLVAGKLAPAPPGTPVESLEARNVLDGLALVRYVTRTEATSYPFGLTGLLPDPDTLAPGQIEAVEAEVRALVEIQDALADLAVAEGVHQAVLGNPDRAAASMDAYTTTGNPPDPDVVRTPIAGQRLNHRIGLHLPVGLPPETSPVPGLAVTPRGTGDPAVNQWLAGLLPPPGNVVCQVTWKDPVTNAQRGRVVTQAEAGLQPIDLLWALRPDDQPAMTDLDDRITGRVVQAENLRGDTDLLIAYTSQVAGKITFFELSPLVASLRSLLLAARPARPTDYTVPAGGGTLDPHGDDDVGLPRARPQAVRDAMSVFITSLGTFLTDLGALDPTAHRPQLLSGVDTFLTRYAQLAVTASGLGLARSGWGELALWRCHRFDEVLTAVRAVADRMTASLNAASEKITQYDALPAGAPADQRLALLQQAERLLTTAPASPQPGTPQQLRTIVGNLRTAYSNELTRLTAITNTRRSTLSGLLSDVSALPALAPFDAAGLDLTPVADAVLTFCADLLARALNLHDEATQRLTAADAALAAYDHATDGPGRVAAATAAIRATLGPDALATSEFGISQDLGQSWQEVLAASNSGQLTQHLTQDLPPHLTQDLSRDFAVDDWLHGLARVRPRVALWERIVLFANAIGQDDPDLVPVQLPYSTGDPWLGLEIPASFRPGGDHMLIGDRLLYTAHYATPFSPGREQCALLLDEWTETIPAATATTGIAAHYDRPRSQPPQTMLLVVPPARTGGWNWDDLVAAVGETLDLTRIRAVEPGHLDDTGYAQLLPATVLSAPPQPITIATDFSVNNDKLLAPGPFRPAGG